jgi:hypothetical protein
MIRDRAYRIWEAEGHPHGREAEHWERARRELDDETSRQPADLPPGVAPLGGIEPAVEALPAQPPSSRPKTPARAAAKPAASTAEPKPAAKRPGKTRADIAKP